MTSLPCVMKHEAQSADTTALPNAKPMQFVGVLYQIESIRKHLRQLHDSALGSCVGGDGNSAVEGDDGSDIDDGSAVAFAAVAAGRVIMEDGAASEGEELG
ncbi:hypothetical protein VTN00DRAFT_5425 [Thermoascus crustaceus]|uniref:uncharacterized protein n=1 Tax=Thermoascus crustaceus TaxID=5088 RepID=UPI003744A9B4